MHPRTVPTVPVALNLRARPAAARPLTLRGLRAAARRYWHEAQRAAALNVPTGTAKRGRV
ncbi:hypothetical protein [Streptomyces purpurogeneiscleroticus]|uniref:hypothetical protein n=1 Tax=Streptomyces purpurogeneiscleroticus TaxID=68259 RepID=UPI001CBA977A|nr:hypothetical protein [Streptomyces purpurogeneiscleroticus]MBZ4015223.1 hypothetical protein [Streptomyces purpurogeneiscleroticus]